MKTSILSPLLLAGMFLVPPSGSAARVSEPHATFYGRVVQRLANRELLVTEGKLRWTIASTLPGGKQYELNADLKSLGDGQFSYVLRIPHQLLAYDLTVTDKAVPLTAASRPFRHASVTVNGQPAILQAPAVDSFTASQSTRAASYRIDLDVSDLSPDSDGDGIPDWWEDQHGTDKWNPLDGPAPVSAVAAGQSEESLTSFALWRAHYFPADQRDLNLFATEDLDGDRMINLLEYAFGLTPLANDEIRTWLPAMNRQDGNLALEFGARRRATDLEYVIEISDDLLSWQRATTDEIEITTASGDSIFDRVSVRLQGTANIAHSFLRVRVNRKL